MVRFGVMISPDSYKTMLERSVLADKLGFDSLWVPDHIILENVDVPSLDAWSVLSAVALNTEKATLGTSVTDPFRRHPAVLAQTVATLDQISQGRAVLGLGAGEAMNVVPFNILWNKRLTRIRETIEIARELWSQRVIEYNGQVYSLSNAFIQVFPIDRKVPIYLAANSPKTRELVGTHADGWLAEMMSPERYKTDAQEVFDAARLKGRYPENIDVVCVITTSVSMDVDKSRETAFQMAKRRFLWWPKQLQEYGYESTEEFDWNHLMVNKETSDLIGEHLEEIPDEACEAVTLYGKPDDCIERIEKYVENGVSHFEFDIPQEYEETCRLIAEKIIPYFKA